MHRITASLPLLLLAACTPTPSGGSTLDNAAAAPDAYLVWSHPDSSQPGETRWLDADGRQLGRAEGVWISHGGALYRLQQTEHDFELPGCDDHDDDPTTGGDAGSGHGTELALVSQDGARRIALGEPLTSGGEEDVGTLHQTAQLRGSVGRYLFVEEGLEIYACGAHGSVAASAHVIDLDTGRPAEPPLVADADVDHLRDDAAAGFAAEARDGGYDPWEGAPSYGETVPTWTDAALGVQHLMWTDTCYACGNGEWSSYTSGMWVADDQVPPALAAEGAVPAPVAHAMANTPEARGVSSGHADASWRAVFQP